MNDTIAPDAHGVLTEPTTLEIQRLLPGPIERVWAYLTESELRRKWLAAGEMALKPGATFTLTWRNDELTDPPGARPDGLGCEHSMQSRIIAVDPPRLLSFTFGTSGEVTFALAPAGTRVLLTLTHRRLPDRPAMLMLSAGWHAHLDVLVARASGAQPEPFWDRWLHLKAEYDRRLPA
jgi:uncharacterized protein YndB with AHSA1/START domain